MPLYFRKDIDINTRLAVWQISEPESFFLETVPLQRNITHPQKRLQHLAGRYLLRHLFPGFPLELIRVADTRKPFLENEAYHFSISHCGEFAAVIVSTSSRVGVDIEIPSEKVKKIRRKFLDPSELAQTELCIAGLTGNPKPAIPGGSPADIILFTLMWCCKEAVYKWWSYGKVDFRKNIRLIPLQALDSGSMAAEFNMSGVVPLQLFYHVFEPLTLAWVYTPGEELPAY